MTHNEVTAAMKAEGVDPALVEKAERTLAFGICRDNSPVDGVKCDCPTDEQIRVVIAAVTPEIQAQALQELLSEFATWHVYDTRDIGGAFLADNVIEEVSELVARLTATAREEPS